MSNDLLFSILPRANNRVPIKDRGQIKRIDPLINTEALNEEEKEGHSNQRKITEKEQYREHQQSQGKQSGQDLLSGETSGESDARDADVYDGSGEKSAETSERSSKRRKHIDKYV